MKQVTDGHARERPYIKRVKESNAYNYCVTCGMAYSRKEAQCPMCARRNRHENDCMS